MICGTIISETDWIIKDIGCLYHTVCMILTTMIYQRLCFKQYQKRPINISNSITHFEEEHWLKVKIVKYYAILAICTLISIMS